MQKDQLYAPEGTASSGAIHDGRYVTPAIRGERQIIASLWRSRVAGRLVLLLALLLLIPPLGILTENEENYFALAEHFIAGADWPASSAVFDNSPHRMLGDATLGTLVTLLGYGPTEILTRLLSVVAYAAVLLAFCRAFALSAMDAAIAVIGLALLGQNLVGGEWLFEGYEAKVPAYILVLAGLRSVLVSGRLRTATLLFAAATYFHFLVGGFWFAAAMVLRGLQDPREGRRILAAAAVFALLVSPLAGLIVWSRLGDASATLATGMPTPDVIYSIIREPHHQSPFLTWSYFRHRWLPGYALAAAMLLPCLWAARRASTQQLRVVALWIGGLLIYLILVLGPKYLDRNTGVLGKFYLFRPSSLILLLWLVLMLSLARGYLARWGWLLRASLLVILLPLFLYAQYSQVARGVAGGRALEVEKEPLVQTIKAMAPPGQIVLIDPDLDTDLLDIERRTRRPTWVNWKFTPTNDAQILEWYRRMQQRQSLFEHGCAAGLPTPDVALLVTTPAGASRLAAGCGREVYRGNRWAVLRLDREARP